MVWRVTINETCAYSYHEAQVGPISPVSASEYLMSGPTAGRTFESRTICFTTACADFHISDLPTVS